MVYGCFSIGSSHHFPDLSQLILHLLQFFLGLKEFTALDTLCFLKEFKAGRFPRSLKSSNPVFPREIPSLFWWKIHVVFLFVAKTSMPARPARPGSWPFSLRKWPRRYSIIHHKYNLRNYSIDIWYDMWYMIYDIWYIIYDIWYMIYDIRYMIYDIWYIIYDIWYMIYDIRYMIYDIWYMIYYIRYMIYYIRYMIYYIWYMIYDMYV